jgi:hypothetical protein
MGLKLAIFLGAGRTHGRARQATNYQFRNYVSRPSRLAGVSLFRWLCVGRSIPEEVIVLGGPRAEWDVLHELAAVPAEQVDFQRLNLRAHAEQGGVSQAQLDELGALLARFLTGVKVRCLLLPEREPEPGALWLTLAGLFRRGDEVHLDLIHDPHSAALITPAAVTLLTQGLQLQLGGVYLGDPQSTPPGGVCTVLVLDRLGELVEWSSALTLFRQSGLIGKLPDLLRPVDAQLAEAMRAINFAVTTFQYEALPRAWETTTRQLETLLAQPPRTIGHLFARQLVHEVQLIPDGHLAEWELEFARRALHSGDLWRATILIQEAVISASIGKPGRRLNHAWRRRALEILLDPRHKQDLYPVDPWPFLRLHALRQILLGNPNQDRSAVADVISSPTAFQQFLERALAFAAVLVARFKRVPPV